MLYEELHEKENSFNIERFTGSNHDDFNCIGRRERQVVKCSILAWFTRCYWNLDRTGRLHGWCDSRTYCERHSGCHLYQPRRQPGSWAKPVQVLASGVQLITKIFKNGTAPVDVKAEPTLTGIQGGCPNDNWTANIDFVYWTNATITVTDPSTDPDTVLLQQNYTCVTTRDPDSVSCMLVP